MDAMDTDAPAAVATAADDPADDEFFSFFTPAYIQSIQASLIMLKSEFGEQYTLEMMHSACELYRKSQQERAARSAADGLASLFAEFAISEAQLTRSQPVPPPAAGSSIILDANQTSIQLIIGMKKLMLDLFADGSNFLCTQCCRLISNLFKEEHLAIQCSLI